MPLLYELKIYLQLRKKGFGYYCLPDDLSHYIPYSWRYNSDIMEYVKKQLDYVSFDNLSYAVVTISEATAYFAAKFIKIKLINAGPQLLDNIIIGQPTRYVSMIEMIQAPGTKPNRIYNYLACRTCLNLTENFRAILPGSILSCSHNSNHPNWSIPLKKPMQ